MINKKLFTIVKKFEKLNRIKEELDQNFLIDQEVIDELVRAADIKKNERIIEIGIGLGFITSPLAKKAKEVISIEIDQRFKPFLKNLPENVKLIFADVYKLFCDKKWKNDIGKINKIIGNIPYRKAENLLHPIIKNGWFSGELFWIIPASFVNKVNNHPIFSAYLKAHLLKKISKQSFYPMPKTVSAIVHFQRINDPINTKDIDIFIRRWLYEHEHWKLKNALREGIIAAGQKITDQFITKNQARKIIGQLKIETCYLEKNVFGLSHSLYWSISKSLDDYLRDEK